MGWIDHGHLALAQELAQLARALRETVGQLGPLHRRRRILVRRGDGRLVLHVRAAEAELEVGEVQDVALAERRVLDQGPVQEGAVLAAEVAQPQAGTQGVDLRVRLGDGVRGQHQLEPVAAADAEGQRVDPDAPERAALGDGLQVPARLADRRTVLAAPRLVAHARAPAMPHQYRRGRKASPSSRVRSMTRAFTAAGGAPPLPGRRSATRDAGAGGAPRSRRRWPGGRRGSPACGRTASARGERAAPRSRRPPPPP